MAMLEPHQLVTVNHGKPFEDMARDIANAAPAHGKFGGAYVIVPPEGEPISFMMTASPINLLQFWSAVKNVGEVGAAEAVRIAQNAAQDPWVRR